MYKIILIKLSKQLVKPLYYIIHYNFFFGFLQKYFFKYFKFRKFTFNINYQRISLSYASSFLFKTYEYNDRVLIEKYISTENKCIIIGGGIGFIPCLSYHKSKNKIIVSEIDETITPLLNSNLKNTIENKSKATLFSLRGYWPYIAPYQPLSTKVGLFRTGPSRPLEKPVACRVAQSSLPSHGSH